MTDNNMREREESGTHILGERIAQIFSKVSSIDNKLDKYSDKLNQVDIKLALIEQREDNLEKEIKEQETKTENAKKTAIGAIITVLCGVAVAIIKVLIGV